MGKGREKGERVRVLVLRVGIGARIRRRTVCPLCKVRLEVLL